MPELHVLRVFVDESGAHGNPLGVFLDGAAIPPERRAEVAARLGFSETVFVDDAASGEVRVFTPGRELAFAGHPLVGTAWLLASGGLEVPMLRPPAGEVPTWEADGLRWIRGRAAWVHEIDLEQLPVAAAAARRSGAPPGVESLYVWAWEDEAAGRVRSRYFAPGLGIAEDEATGAAAVVLTDRLGRAVGIRQGRGSRLRARPGPDGTVEVGGRAVLDEVRDFAL
jgi:predicted PhzF superfamily epimerase YddE/YHI9